MGEKEFFEEGLALVDDVFPEVGSAIRGELKAQRSCLKMIASENFCSMAVQAAMGNLLTDKYAEGYSHHRFYAGCEMVDQVEDLACVELKKLFGAEYASVQAHSGSVANEIALWAMITYRVQDPELDKIGKNLLQLTDDEFEALRQKLCNVKILAPSLHSGGHLTHGTRMNVVGKTCCCAHYDVDRETQRLDYDAILAQARSWKPDILIAGYSAYTRKIDFEKMREIADAVGALLWVDMAHFAGLVAGKVYTGIYDPIPYAHVVTSTTHKTLRGPRGGLVLSKKEFGPYLDKACPMAIGGPIPNMMAAKAVAFKEANTKEFQVYAAQIMKNAEALAKTLMACGAKILTDGTENHMVILDVMSSFGLTGRQAESVLLEAGITLNRNAIPFDAQGAWYTSGIRIGVPALTTLGMEESEMEIIGRILYGVLKQTKPQEGSLAKYQIEPALLQEARQQVEELLGRYRLYKELD